MRKLTNFTAASALLVAAFAPATMYSVPASASSPSQQACEDAGGVFTRVGGQVTCEITVISNVGNSPNSQTVVVEEYEGSNGTFNNHPKHAESEECDGPGGSLDKSSHCPD